MKTTEKTTALKIYQQAVQLTIISLCLVAVIPITAQSNKKWKFVHGKNYPRISRLPLRAWYLDNDNDTTTIESVNFSDCDINGWGTINNCVENLTDYTFKIIGDDGVSWGKLEYSKINLTEYKDICINEIVEDLRSFALSPKNKAFEIKQVKGTLIPDRKVGVKSLFDFQTQDLSWMTQATKYPHDYGKNIYDIEITTNVSKYYLSCYSSDENNDTFETIVITRPKGFIAKLDGLTQVDLTFVTTYSRDEKVSLGKIDISWPEVGQFSIFDNQLFNEIYSLALDKKNNGAISLNVIECDKSVTSGGIIHKASEPILKKIQ
ncbi:MAG: hypothetical protein IJR71_03275 [Prevotella sp.]|nr:hypothetical protein [Prevotella sp.]